MKMVKSLILGSAAALVAMSGAQAADLPVKAKPVEYVKICSLYGAGFYYIPGTDTCIKLGGYLRVDLGVNTNGIFTGNTNGAGGANNRYTNAYTWRSREDLNIDTRTATEYGVVRTFFDATFTWTSGTYAAGATAGSTIYESIGGTAAPQNASQGGVALGALGVYYAFIQFAGFTVGKAVSQFSAPWQNYPGNINDFLVGGGGDVTGVNQFTYTAEFGNGVSASISAQDQVTYYQAGVNNLSVANATGSFAGAFGASDYGGTIAPDVVGMIRVDQAWGLFQASAAAHNNRPAYYGATEATGGPGDKWGFAAQLALSIKNIPTGPGDTINVSGVYTDGATRYNIQDLSAAAGAAVIYGKSSGFYQSVGLGIAPDSIFAAGTDQQLIQTWGLRGAYTHNWSPYWSSSLFGAYAAVRYNGTAKALICATPGIGIASLTGGGAGITNCNPDYNIGQLGVNLSWKPVPKLAFTAEALWTHLDQNFAGTVNAASAAIGKPATVYQIKDQDTWQVFLRAQRNF